MFCVVLAEIFFIIFVKLFNYNYVVVIVVSYNLSQNAIFCVILAEIFFEVEKIDYICYVRFWIYEY